MIPPGERYATKDYRVAKRLAKERRAELRRLQKANLDPEHGDLRRLRPFVDYHLQKEAENGRSLADLTQVEQRLNAAVQFFGEETLLREIDTLWLQQYVSDVKQRLRWQGTPQEIDEPIATATQVNFW